jgi:hypothetical protein
MLRPRALYARLMVVQCLADQPRRGVRMPAFAECDQAGDGSCGGLRDLRGMQGLSWTLSGESETARAQRGTEASGRPRSRRSAVCPSSGQARGGAICATVCPNQGYAVDAVRSYHEATWPDSGKEL